MAVMIFQLLIFVFLGHPSGSSVCLRVLATCSLCLCLSVSLSISKYLTPSVSQSVSTSFIRSLKW